MSDSETTAASVEMPDETPLSGQGFPERGLDSAQAVVREMRRVYYSTLRGKMRQQTGRGLMWMLSQMIRAHEVVLLEKRLDAIEAQTRALLPDGEHQPERLIVGVPIALDEQV